MMRTLLILIALGWSLPCLWAQSMPDLETTVEAFFRQYKLDEQQFYSLGFERRPDGYYVVYKNDGRSITDRELFYDATVPTAGFNSINSFDRYFGTNNAPQVAEEEQLAAEYLRFLGKYTTDVFERQPYYGYDGWYKDAIVYFEEKEVLDDDELHALARVQSVAAASLLANNRGFGIEKERFTLPMGQNALSDIQLITYREEANKCLDSYLELKQRNPDYVTPVGPVAIKYANEVMDVFLTLLYFQNAEVAMDMLEEKLYPEYLLRNARNLLNSCPPNSILITYGDNDTYPLYYLQAMSSYRKDVLIANYSLLNISRYRLMFLQQPLWTTPIKTGLPANHFEEEALYWAQTRAVADTLSMELIYQLLPEAKNYYQGVFKLPNTTIALPVPENTATLIATEPGEALIWDAGRYSAFVLPPEIFIADALTANKWQRPVCFTNTVGMSVLRPWRDHLAREGLVYRLYPEIFPGVVTDFRTAAVNLDYSLDFWYERMEFDTTTEQATIDQLSFYSSNVLTGITIATRLGQLGRATEAQQFCQFLLSKYPNKVSAWDDNWVYILRVLLDAGDQGTAKMIYDTLVANLNTGLVHEEDDSRRASLGAKLQQIGVEQGWY